MNYQQSNTEKEREKTKRKMKESIEENEKKRRKEEEELELLLENYSLSFIDLFEGNDSNHLDIQGYDSTDNFEDIFNSSGNGKNDQLIQNINQDSKLVKEKVFNLSLDQEIPTLISYMDAKSSAFSQVDFSQQAIKVHQLNHQIMEPTREPKSEFQLNLEKPRHLVMEGKVTFCFYCGMSFGNLKPQKIISHLNEEVKKTGYLIVPIFHLKKDGELKKAFIKDCFNLAMETKDYGQLKKNFRRRFKIDLGTYDKKTHVYRQIPNTFKLPKNSNVTIYEFDYAAQNIIDEFVKVKISYIDTGVLIG